MSKKNHGGMILTGETRRIRPSATLSRVPGSSSSIVSGYGLDDRAIEVRSPTEENGLFL
jgi:hypothetical protein